MIRSILVAAALVAGISTVVAQSDPIVQRQEIMKKGNQAARNAGNMVKGTVPFDLAVVQTTLKNLSEDYKIVPTLFPEGSQTGHETRALPKIWTEKPKFDAAFASFQSLLATAQASVKDEASFKVEMPKVLQACDSCHETYRAARQR